MYCLMQRVGVAWGEEDDHDAGAGMHVRSYVIGVEVRPFPSSIHSSIHPSTVTAGHRGLTPMAAAFKVHVLVVGKEVIDATSGAGKPTKEKEEAKPSGPGQPAGDEKGKDKKVCFICVLFV